MSLTIDEFILIGKNESNFDSFSTIIDVLNFF